jgi:D-alanyl-D-alanine carboxypeptidase
MVSTAAKVCRYLEALLGGEVLAPRLRAEMLNTVPADWEESDRYGLGIEEMTSLVGIVDSPCGVAWGHLGFALGYTTIALASENGDRRVVIALNGFAMSPEPLEAVGRLVWACYCSGRPGRGPTRWKTSTPSCSNTRRQPGSRRSATTSTSIGSGPVPSR